MLESDTIKDKKAKTRLALIRAPIVKGGFGFAAKGCILFCLERNACSNLLNSSLGMGTSEVISAFI